MAFKGLFGLSSDRRAVLASGHVVPEPSRCVQCGICSYYCPIEINVRLHVWRNEAITHSACLTCGECVARCPRDVLRFEQTDLFKAQAG
jgi:Pyruvate/2-oxoacid:ferredoxin oxidoreductase delta subunit